MTLDATFRVLAAIGTPSALDVAMEALEEPDEAIQRHGAECILEHGGRTTLSVLIESYDSLYPDVQRFIDIRAVRMLPVLAAGARSGREETRLASYAILRAAKRPEAAATLAGGLADPSEKVRDVAAGGLKELTLMVLSAEPREVAQTVTPMGEDSVTSPMRRSLLEGMMQALKTYHVHRNRVVLECLLMLGADTYWLFLDAIASGGEALVSDAASVLESFNTPASVAVLLALARERVDRPREIARQVLGRKGGARFAKGLSEYLMALPIDLVLRIASSLDELPWWEKTFEYVAGFGDAHAKRVVTFLENSRMFASRKVELAHGMMKSTLGYVRRLGLEMLSRLDAAAAGAIVEGSLCDPDERVQCSACEIVARLELPNRVKLLAPLINSESESVRKTAIRAVSEDGFKRYLASFNQLDARVRELAGKAIAKIDPDMIDKLSEELQSLDASRRLKAVRVLDVIDREKEAEPLLLDLIRDPDRRVRATVVKTLGILGSVEALKHLIKALSDPDKRVMANAIETFEDFGDPRVADLLLPFLKHPDNRVRANAAKALFNLGHPEVKGVLLEMLSDANEPMRLSAAWALGELGISEAEARLSDMASSDPSERVRERAKSSVERLREAGREGG